MSNTFVIQWKSKVNGRAGRGTKTFEKAEAEQLAEELNREYPQIEHEIVEVQGAPLASAEEQSASEQPATTSTSTSLLSIA